MPEIHPIRIDQVAEARRLIYSIAAGMWNPGMPLEEAFAMYDRDGELADMDDIQASYIDKGGAFLVMLDGERLIGTGAIRPMEDGVGEIKRLWFWPEYHGQGLGYRMMMRLLEIARENGYRKVRLQTDPIVSKRGYDLYRGLGFVEIPYPTDWPDEVWMELELS